jgi:uncharacterized protein YaiE (UPF0345 family)
VKHSVYFDGKVQSLELATAKGRATVGVIEPGQYQFSTSSEERITVIEGLMKTRLPGAGWQELGQGEELVVPKGVSFDIDAPAFVAYICYYL